MTLYISFGHRKLVGKDTAARFLCSHLRINRRNSDIRVVGFADKLKNIVHQLYAWANVHPGDYYEQPENRRKKEELIPVLGMTYRELLIKVGNGMRAVYGDTWIDYLLRSIHCDVLIIKDMRFENEADKIHEVGGYVYKIERNCVPKQDDGADDPLEDYTEWNGIISNQGTIEEFNKRIVVLAEGLLSQLK